MTSRINPENLSTGSQNQAGDPSQKAGQSTFSTNFTRVDPDRQGDIASSGQAASSQDTETWDPLLNSAGSATDRKGSTSSRYAFTHDELAHPDE